MSGHGKKGGKKSGSHKASSVNMGDVTLADYANSTVAGRGRLGKAKSSSFSVVREVKQLNIQETTWDQKLEELDEDIKSVQEQNEDEEVLPIKKAPRRKKTLSESIKEGSCNGNMYPLDIWHLIAQYIRPEDTARFASICRSAWCVVNSPTYWLNLYKRHYKNVPNLPSRLKPECMVRLHGLKACVVRSLFYMYPPLAARVDQGNMSTPHDLRSRQCISVWQERFNNKWKICFKMRRKDCHPNKTSREKIHVMDIVEDIFDNPDDGCTILQVVSAEKTLPPTVMGLTLHSIQMSLELTLATMHVQLVFGSGRIYNGHLDSTGTVALSLKTVVQVSVLDWWHPRYPHSPYTNIGV